MPQFTVNEQAILDDCVARRSDQFQRPAWMQSARATAIKLEARRRIAALPPALPEERTTSRTHYEAARRVVAYDRHGNPYRFHEADEDHRSLLENESTRARPDSATGVGTTMGGSVARPAPACS